MESRTEVDDSPLVRQLKDRRKNRTNRLENKNQGILRFGSLSVKVSPSLLF
jgi:hypothetical protein